MNKNTYRILGKNETISNNTWITGLNNNDLIIGPSGAGKTRNYVKPNIMQCNESLIIADTKGSLYEEVGPVLKNNGYKVLLLNFNSIKDSCGYNPFDYIHYDKRRKKYSEQDIMKIAACLVPIKDKKEPFWEQAAQLYVTSMIAYILECLPKRQHTLEYVYKLYAEMHTGNFDKLFSELEKINPNSYAIQCYKLFQNNKKADKMHSSIIGILSEKLNGLIFDDALEMYRKKDKIDFTEMGKRKTAVFLTISDTDRSMDRMANLFYTQALQELCKSADTDYPDHRLPIPVRFILDDFATNVYIPDFDKIISVIRSREVSVSIILQSISQLTGLYGEANAMTIINNCDNWIYLGGQDINTANIISIKANKAQNTILNMPLNQVYLFTRGQEARRVEKYNLRDHEKYNQLPEARKECSPCT
ncbi:VirD4-like conjugal transfer protein, CD1115 family [Roseburia sp. 499]|uniref:VirD4-like conjugal transfer protein, CD1115 family n=1 Tax=Roseburia sp. 499 TaxID=1261634 RepID=UPI00095200B6|nr:type IV secretory system conjugative DNA transfer family protein [Roseburia sp. 499]WVK69427.1 type IV secretory system conjugative DNA transfer family protein [Roseburia sp. 499]